MTPGLPSAAPTTLETVAELRERLRGEARCQIVRDSILPRGLAQPWALRVDGTLAGYAGLWKEHYPGRLMDVVVLPEYQSATDALLGALIRASGAETIEWQSNLTEMATVAERAATDAGVEHLLFADGPETDLAPAGAVVRPRASVPVREGDPEGAFVVVHDGRLVAAGGILTHYNPPYGDLYMVVVESARGRGFGSFLVQELRRVARARGHVPAARCGPSNEASRRTLLRAGMVECGRLLSGRIADSYRGDRTGE